MDTPFVVATAVALYSEEDWVKIRERSKDFSPDIKSYTDWQKKREALLKELEDKGHRFDSVTVDFKELNHWLSSRHMANDKSGRNRYIEYMLDKRYPLLRKENISYIIFD